MPRILCKDLKLHPYKTVLVQELCERDHGNCRLLNSEIHQQVSCDDLAIFSGKAHFHLSRTVSKQNFRYWLHNNPHMRFKNAHCIVLMLLHGAQYQNFTFGTRTFSEMTMVR